MVCPKSLPSHVAMLQYEASDKYVYISSLKGDAAQIEPRPPLVIMAFTQGGSLHLVPLLQNLKDGFHLSFVCKDGEQEDIQDV